MADGEKRGGKEEEKVALRNCTYHLSLPQVYVGLGK